MSRSARIVAPGFAHHITQRGNRRQDVFFSDEDRETYLRWLGEYCARHEVEVLTYALMTNHVHLVAVPRHPDSFSRALGPLHMRHSQRVNGLHGWSGHLWQARYFSSPLDERHTWAAIRYVERNPVRAGLVRKAEEYWWSGAAAHCGLRRDPLLTSDPALVEMIAQGPLDWPQWLAGQEDEASLSILKRNFSRGLPCGSEAFISELERDAGRELRYRPAHRPREKGDCPT